MDRVIHLKDQQAKTAAENLLRNLPIGGLDVVIRPHKEMRSPSQNALMWAAVIGDITNQAWLNGKQYSEKVWHKYFKEQYMPELTDPDLNELVKDPTTYVKWVESPSGNLECIASTTQLTKKGFSRYLEQVYAFGADLGVMFTAVQR